MKNVAIMFNQVPHGNAKGREALDLSLAISDINHVTVFFINDGVFHLLSDQQPEKILMRDYIATLGMLDLYDITDIYACETSLKRRGLHNQNLVIDTQIISQQAINDLLATQDVIFQF